MALAGTPASAGANPIYVDDDAPVGGDGTSWAAAFKHLQDALAAATPGDEIRVAGGTYTPDQDATGKSAPGDRAATFQLKNGVALWGGYAGLAAPDPDLRDIVLHVSILSGDLASDDIPLPCTQDSPDCDGALGKLCGDNGLCIISGNNTENSYHVITGSGTDATALLNGFTITAGNANGAAPFNRGGGMYNETGSPMVAECTFSGNSATTGGGVDNVFGSNPKVTNCRIMGNSAFVGGGMANTVNSGPSLTDCSFHGNSAGNSGGGIANASNSSPVVSNCTFDRNRTTQSGGGVVNFSSDPTVTNCLFSGNSAGNSGGGMANTESSPKVSGCRFSNNSAINGGGLINFSGGSPTVTYCTFTNNTARAGGGGMYNYYVGLRPKVNNCTFIANSHDGMLNLYSNPTVTNCFFAGNVGPGMRNDHGSPSVSDCAFSSNGGGMDNVRDSNPTVTNCTFSGNATGNSRGGGMYNSGSRPTVNNCIFWGNSPHEIFNFDPTVDMPTVRFSAVQDGLSPGTIDGGSNIDADPLFVNTGGSDGIPGTEDDDLRLGPGSPCIDAGHNGAVPLGVTTDILGNRRFYDDPATQDTGVGLSPIVDMGAYEFGSAPCAGADLDCDGDVDLRDFATLQGCFGAIDPLACNPTATPDVDGSGQVDLHDHAVLEANLTGPR
ncbi:MAG: right-handed parallel beta-helix repeat-containing protein [Planctomycetes bacterium]|nr:right-handed parallel beta-helix repeat-containing protein [Planctomycetota bacterium]